VQLQALDSGIVTRARAILNTAEAAYRVGERGILETLDAQRQFRLVRNELIVARHSVALARIELERLSGL
jgi:cobalt-zinc-cadmium efflux system outer membrane protein